MGENWRAYFRGQGKVALVGLDLGLRHEAPMPGKPWLLWVWLQMLAPRPDGLVDESESEVFMAIEDQLTKQVEQACHAIKSGRITTDGKRGLYFYGARSDGFKKAISEVMERFKNYKFVADAKEDPQWNHYLNVLYPTEEQMQCLTNLDVIVLLLKRGDTLKAVRDVHHGMCFRTRVARERYAADVKELGYQIVRETDDTEGE